MKISSHVPKTKQKLPTKTDDDDVLFTDSYSVFSSSTKPISSLSPPETAAPVEAPSTPVKKMGEAKTTLPATSSKKESHDLFGSPPRTGSDDDLFSGSTSTSKPTTVAPKAKVAAIVVNNVSAVPQKDIKRPAKIGGEKNLFGASDSEDDLFSEYKSRKATTPDTEVLIPVKNESSPLPVVSKKRPIGGVAIFGGADPFNASAGKKEGTPAMSPSLSTSSSIAQKQDKLCSGQSPEDDLFSKKPVVRQIKSSLD